MKAKISLLGISATVPANSVELSEYEALFGKKLVRRIKLATGINRIRVAPRGVCASDMAFDCADRLLTAMSFDRSKIGGLIFVSQSPDYQLPATSCLLQDRLNLRRSIFAVDCPYGCSGFTYGVAQAAMAIEAGVTDNVLVICSDTIARKVNDRDRSSKMLFGDGAASILVSRSNSFFAANFFTDGSGGEHIIIPAGGSRIPVSDSTGIAQEYEESNWRSQNDLYMNGSEVTSFALEVVPKLIDDLLIDINWSKAALDCVLLHQASSMLIKNIIKKIGVSEDIVPIHLKNFGNTSSASIPLAFVEEYQFLDRRPKHLLAAGFGVGLSASALVMDVSTCQIVPTSMI